MVGMAPLLGVGCRDRACPAFIPVPIIIAASGLLAAFFGGWVAVRTGPPVGAIIALVLGG